MKKRISLVMLFVMVLLAVTGCGGGSSAPAPAANKKMTIQLKWLPQSQFMGYYVAQAKGYYAAEGIDITILPGGSDIIPEQMVFNGAADVGVTWVSSLLKYQEQGWGLLHVSQTFQDSGMLLVSKAATGVETPMDLKGKKIGSWFGGNEYELFALLENNGIDREKDVTLVQQDFTMNQILDGRIDVASAMIYNEYGLLLAAGLKPEELRVIDFNKEGVAMMQDCLFVNKDWIKNNEELFVKFLRASNKGWADAVADPEGIRGQIVKATVVLVKDRAVASEELAKEVQTYVKEKTAPYKYPRIVEFVDELPKTISGKIRRKAIRDEDSNS